MAERGGQPGNRNATKNRDWTDALKLALARKGEGDYRIGLRLVAEKVIDKAEEGDVNAWKEVSERVEGKVKQVIAGDPDEPLQTRSLVEVVFKSK